MYSKCSNEINTLRHLASTYTPELYNLKLHIKVLLETFVGHLCVSFKKNNYDSLPESRNALLLDMQRSTLHDCRGETVPLHVI